MTDRIITTLVVSGLVVQAAALAGGFTSLGWRWPMVAAGALVSLGSLVAAVADGGRPDGQVLGFCAFNLAVLCLAVGHAFSTHPGIAWPLRIGIGIQALGLALLLLFLLTFKMRMF
jgi:hypothetical protein